MDVQDTINAIRNVNSNDELNQIIDAVKLQRQFIAKKTIRSVVVGDAVEFVARGRTVIGEVVKVNRKNVKVREAGFGTWNVPANMLSVAEKV